MPTVTVEDGVSIYAQDVGSGPPVVLLAGFGLSHAVWDAEVRVLAERHRVVCVDLRGTGTSGKPSGGYAVERLAADVEAVLAALDLRDVALVGWSFGGQVALQVAARDPRVRTLVLVASNGVSAARTGAFAFGPVADEIEPRLLAAEQADRLGARRRTILSGFARKPSDDVADFLLRCQLEMPSWAAVASYHSYLRTDLTSLTSGLTMPVVQILGELDPVVPAAGAAWLQEHLPDARLVTLDGCGHYPMFEAQTAFDEALAAAVASPGERRRARPAGSVASPRATVEAFYTALTAKDAAAVSATVERHFAEDARLARPESLPGGGVVEGRRRIARFLSAAAAAPAGGAFDPAEMRLAGLHVVLSEDGDRVFADVRFPFAGVATRALECWRFESAEVAELRAFYWDTASMLGGAKDGDATR